MPDSEAPDPSTFDDPTPEGLTPRQRWLHANFKLVALVLSIGVSPVCAHYASGRVETMRQKFEREDRERKRQVELRIHQQKMRTSLVKEIVSIAKSADLNNLAHAYRIGLIAEIVMTNPDVFRLNMKDAQDKLDVIVKKMKVVHNVRKQLAATEKSEASLQVKVKQFDTENATLEKRLKKTRKKYDKVKWKSYAERVKWRKKVTEVEKALQRSTLKRLEYSNRLSRERRRRARYAFYLRYTQRRFQANLRAAKKAKAKSAKEVTKLNGMLSSLEAKATTTGKELAQLKELVQKLRKAKEAAETTAQTVNDEAKKLRAANKVLVTEGKKLAAKLAECQPPKKTP